MSTSSALLVSDEDELVSTSDESDTVSNDVWMGVQKEQPRRGVCTRFFKSDVNPVYANHLGLAIRCGLVGACLTMLTVTSDGVPIPFLNFSIAVPGNAAMLYIFTMKPFFGMTLELARSGIFGRVLAAVCAHVMCTIFPEEGGTAIGWWAMLVWGVVFTWGMLFFDFNINTRKFALLSFAGHFMKFLNPDARLDPAGHDEASHRGVVEMEIVGAVIGCSLAVLTTLFPRPLLSLTHAGKVAENLSNELSETWSSCAVYMRAGKADDDVFDNVSRKVAHLSKQLVTMRTAIDDAAFEVRVLPARFTTKRRMLESIFGLLRQGYDSMFFVWSSCQGETFEESHREFMDGVGRELSAALGASSKLLRLSVAVALDGRLSSRETKELRQCIDGTTAAQQALKVAAQKAMARIQQSVSVDLTQEQSFFFHTCARVTHCVEVAEGFISDSAGEVMLKAPTPAPWNPFAVKVTPDHLSFVIRNFTAILLGLLIGYWGREGVIDRYDGTITATTAILLSKFTGSASEIALLRLQAGMLGYIYGSMLISVFGGCDGWSHVALGIGLFLWVSNNMMSSFHIPKNAMLGQLLAIYGTNTAAKPCSNESKVLTMHFIASLWIAVAIGMAFDELANLLPLPKEMRVSRCSTQAINSIQSLWTSLHTMVSCAFDANELETRKHHMTFGSTLALAEDLNRSAVNEYRAHKAPWNIELGVAVLASLRKMWMIVSAIEDAASGGKPGGNKIEAYLDIIRLPAFQELRRTLADEIDHIAKFMDVLSLGAPALAEQDAAFTSSGVLAKQVASLDGELSLAKHQGDFNISRRGLASVVIEGCRALDLELHELRRRIRRAV